MNAPVEMTVDECLALLSGGVVGRVALATPVGPRIVPVNYVMDGAALVFRTSAYSELGSYGTNSELAFEVDHIDYDRHQGWSVVAIGRGEVLEDPIEVQRIQGSWDLRPWAAGTRNLYIRLAWKSLSGRRLGANWSGDAMMRYASPSDASP